MCLRLLSTATTASVRVTAASEPGTAGEANEDRITIGAGTVAVADGATARTETGCVHGVAWFAERLAASLLANAYLLPAGALAKAIRDTARQHRDTCELDHMGTPAAAVAIAQVRGADLHYLVLGDTTVALQTREKLEVVTDNRVGGTAAEERAAADALPGGSPEKAQALARMKEAELAARNVPGGFWAAAADPAAVAHALTGKVPVSGLRRAAVLTDGAARAVSPLGLYDWPGLLAMLASEGPEELIRQVRAAEAADPAGLRWPRNKAHDDATVAFIEF